MKHTTFNKLYKESMANEKHTVLSKGDEYATDQDRVSNFKNGIALQVANTTPEGVAWNWMSKHLESAMHGLNELAKGNAMPPEFWDAKLGDIIVYSRIIQVMLKDRFEKNN